MSHYIDEAKIEQHGIINALALPSITITSSLNGSYQILGSDPTSIIVTGSATGFTLFLPNVTNEIQGHLHNIYNTTSNPITIKNYDGNILTTISQLSVAYCYLQTSGTSAGVWLIWQVLLSSIASGVICYNISASTPFTTSSASDVIITGFSFIPQAGTYGVWYNSDASATQNNAISTHTIYYNGTAITDSIRRTQSVSSNFVFQQSSMTIISVNGTNTISVRVKTSKGSLTVNGRSLLAVRLGA